MHSASYLARFVLLGAFLALSSACISDDLPARPEEEDDEPTEDASMAMCPASEEVDTCFRCTDENCCTEYAACAADPRCTTYYKTCLPECKAEGKSFSECKIECSSSNGAGHARYVPYGACATRECFAPCSNDTDDPCVNCMFANCSDQLYECNRDPECDLIDACVTLCADHIESAVYDACVSDCTEGASRVSKQRYDASFGCRVQYCLQACES